MFRQIFDLRHHRYADKLRSISLVISDVDGVLTDGGLYYNENGEVQKRFHVRDGLGIKMLQRFNIEVAFLSGGRSGAMDQRAQHLQVKHFQSGIKNKLSAIKKLQIICGITKDQTLFIGDDLNDLIVQSAVALFVVPADCESSLLNRADLVLKSKGGCGAFRELSDCILKSKGVLNEIQQAGWLDQNG